MLIKKTVLIASLAIFTAAGTAVAAEFAGPQKGGDPNITISASERHHNLYTAGANVSVNGEITGDLFLAGGMVNVIGDVGEDLNALGGSLSLSGKVGGDARAAGGNITITSAIGGDLLIAGGNISITEKSTIGGDLVIGGGNIILDAPVKGMLKAAGGNITINSKVEGSVWVQTEENLIFGSKAEIAGKIIHRGKKQAVVKAGANISQIDFQPYSKKTGGILAGFLTLAFLIKLAAWFLAGLVLVKYRQDVLQKIAQSIKEKPWENLGLGLAGLVVIPIIAVLLLVLLVGYYIAGILALWYLLLLMFSGLAGVLFFGAWLRRLITKAQGFIFDWKTICLGVVVMAVLKLILPPLGWLAYFVLVLMTLGALLKVAKERWINENDKN